MVVVKLAAPSSRQEERTSPDRGEQVAPSPGSILSSGSRGRCCPRRRACSRDIRWAKSIRPLLQKGRAHHPKGPARRGADVRPQRGALRTRDRTAAPCPTRPPTRSLSSPAPEREAQGDGEYRLGWPDPLTFGDVVPRRDRLPHPVGDHSLLPPLGRSGPRGRSVTGRGPR